MQVSDADLGADPNAYEPVIAACMALCTDRADCHAFDLKRPSPPAVVCTLYFVVIPEDGHGNNNHADGCGDPDVSFASHHETDPRCYVRVDLNAQLPCEPAFLGDANPLVLDGNQNAHTDFTLFAGAPPMPPMADVRGPAGNEAFHLSFEFAAYPFSGEQYLVSWVDNAGLRVQISLLDTDCSNDGARLSFKVLHDGAALFGGPVMNAEHSYVFRFDGACPDLPVDLDVLRHADLLRLHARDGVLQAVPEDEDEGQALAQLVRARRRPRREGAVHLAEHPVLWRVHALQMVLRAARHGCGVSAVAVSNSN